MHCGPLMVEFFNDDANQTDLDPTLFHAISDGQLHYFSVMESANKPEAYPIKYRVFFLDYLDLVYEYPTPFTITLVDDCANATIEASILEQ